MRQTSVTPINAKVADNAGKALFATPGRYKVANALLLKVAWLCCVLGGVAYGAPALALMCLASFWQRELHKDLPHVLLLGAIGLCLDTLWMYLGVLDYGGAAITLPLGLTLAPAWIVMLWLAVSLSIRHSLIFMVNRPLLGALVVGCGSPLSYLTGEQFGAVAIPSMQGLYILAAVWIVLFYWVFNRAKTQLTAG
ncbi:MAG: DUF2878 family protein [Proteobacteria bacterium]|nr:DUF2878 family protein [Pseudomonadota bacterium]